MVRLRKQNHLSNVKWIDCTWNFPYTNAVTIESVHTSSFCRLGLIPVSLIESINSKYVDCKFGACCFRYEFTKSAGTFSDKKSSIVSDGLRSRTYKEDSKTSIGSDLQRGCKWKRQYQISQIRTLHGMKHNDFNISRQKSKWWRHWKTYQAIQIEKHRCATRFATMSNSWRAAKAWNRKW